MTTRIYAVHDSESDDTRLVEASNAAQAIGYVVANRYTAEVANGPRVALLMTAGTILESAKAPKDDEQLQLPLPTTTDAEQAALRG